MALCIYIDGGARGNPGPAAAGVVIHEGNPLEPVHEAGYFLGPMTNNMAEYNGLLYALDLAAQIDTSEIHVHSDSQLMVRQIQGKYRVQSPTLKPLYEQAKKLFGRFERWQITYVRRQFNQRADAMANLAMDAGRDVIVVPLAGKHNGPQVNATPTDTPDGPTEDAGGPKWTVRLLADPGPKCPACCPAHAEYHFGPTTPSGFCVYAAKTVIGQVLADHPKLGVDPQQVHCEHCRVALLIQCMA